jgi:hypothetical protein
MSASVPLAALRALEIQTHQPYVRGNSDELGKLLHPLFFEIGRSGQVYSRAAILAEFHGRLPSYNVWSQDFQAELVTIDLAFLTYRSAHLLDGGMLERHTLRASLWQYASQGWQMRFHQGTPTAAFERSAR